MARISSAKVTKFLTAAANAHTYADKGKIFEDLVCYLFATVPGITISKRNVLNPYHSEEIDVAFWNTKVGRGLYFLDHIVLVECKNWSSPVSSDEISRFADKLENRSMRFGILVAAHGVTGDPTDMSAARDTLRTQLIKGRQILVITKKEILALGDSEALIHLLQEKLCELAVSGTMATPV